MVYPSCVAVNQSPMQIGVFHPGTQHSWQTALALQQLGRLEWYATSIFYQPDLWPYRLERLLPGRLGDRLHREFSRFSQPALDPRLVRTSGMAEGGLANITSMRAPIKSVSAGGAPL